MFYFFFFSFFQIIQKMTPHTLILMEGLQHRHIYPSSIPAWSKSSTVLKCLEVVEHCILIRGLCCHKDGALGCETWPCLFTVCFSAPQNSYRSLPHQHRSLYRKGKQRLELLKLLLQWQSFKHHQQKRHQKLCMPGLLHLQENSNKGNK